MAKDIVSSLSGMLGLAYRGRMIVCGTDISCDTVRAGKAKIILVSKDASKNTKKRVFNCAEYYEVMCSEIPLTTKQLSDCLGKSGLCAAVALTERNMAKGIINLINEYNAKNSEDNASQEV